MITININHILDELRNMDNPKETFTYQLALVWIDRYSANCDVEEVEKELNDIVE